MKGTRSHTKPNNVIIYASIDLDSAWIGLKGNTQIRTHHSFPIDEHFAFQSNKRKARWAIRSSPCVSIYGLHDSHFCCCCSCFWVFVCEWIFVSAIESHSFGYSTYHTTAKNSLFDTVYALRCFFFSSFSVVQPLLSRVCVGVCVYHLT